jgi:hypothetical protein
MVGVGALPPKPALIPVAETPLLAVTPGPYTAKGGEPPSSPWYTVKNVYVNAVLTAEIIAAFCPSTGFGVVEYSFSGKLLTL